MKRFLAIYLLCATAGTHAQTGGELRDDLTFGESIRRNHPTEHSYIAGYGEGLVAGVLDDMALSGGLCLPDEFQNKQAYVIVKNYIDAHPEKWHLPAAGLVRTALLQFFACKSAP